jgi:hypothetical protein
VAAGDDYTGSFLNIQCYDGLKVNAILNEIDKKNHDGTAPAPEPAIFGMNFQAVSIGQKLIYTRNGGVPPMTPTYSAKGGYLDSIGTPSPSLFQEIKFIDTSIGKMVTELTNQGELDSTLIIITAKHGQSPIDTSRYKPNGSPNDPDSILSACLPDSELNQIGPTEDEVDLIWLKSSCNVATEVTALEAQYRCDLFEQREETGGARRLRERRHQRHHAGVESVVQIEDGHHSGGNRAGRADDSQSARIGPERFAGREGGTHTDAARTLFLVR